MFPTNGAACEACTTVAGTHPLRSSRPRAVPDQLLCGVSRHDRDGAFDVGAAGVEGAGFELFCGGLGGVALDFGEEFGFAEDGAGGAAEDAADGPAAVVVGEEDFAGALLLWTVVPAAEEREMIAEEGEVVGVRDPLFECGESMGGAGLGGFGCAGGERFAFEGDGLKHEGLSEEGAADAGLLFDGAYAEGGEALGAEEAAAVEEEEGGFFFGLAG